MSNFTGTDGDDVFNGDDTGELIRGRGSQYLQAVYGDDGDDTLYTNPYTSATAYGGAEPDVGISLSEADIWDQKSIRPVDHQLADSGAGVSATDRVTSAPVADYGVALAATRPSEVRLSADGLRVFSASSDGAIRVYDARTGVCSILGRLARVWAEWIFRQTAASLRWWSATFR